MAGVPQWLAMTVERAPVWQHQPATGPVAWGASVAAALLVPVPLMWMSIALGVVEVARPAVVTALVWAAIGAFLAAMPHRLARGAGLGVVAGVITCSLVLMSWQS